MEALARQSTRRRLAGVEKMPTSAQLDRKCTSFQFIFHAQQVDVVQLMMVHAGIWLGTGDMHARVTHLPQLHNCQEYLLILLPAI